MSMDKKIEGYKVLAIGTVKSTLSNDKKCMMLDKIEKTISQEWKAGTMMYQHKKEISEVIFNCRTEVLKQKAAIRFGIAA